MYSVWCYEFTPQPSIFTFLHLHLDFQNCVFVFHPGFTTNILYAIPISIHTTCPAYITSYGFDHPNNIRRTVNIVQFIVKFLGTPVISSFVDPNIYICASFSNTVNLFFLNLRDRVCVTEFEAKHCVVHVYFSAPLCAFRTDSFWFNKQVLRSFY
jgi:hypothetical protein